MTRMRKHIHGLNFFNPVAVFAKEQQVALKGFNRTGNIDHSFRGGFNNAAEKIQAASGSRRIHENNVEPFVRLRRLNHEAACVGAEKADVFTFVEPRVENCVRNRVLVQLNSDNINFGALCRNNADCARSAVGVKHTVALFQLGKFNCSAVKQKLLFAEHHACF